jgi:GrpB-like predicted nucleotidyltransferase (UPF0157 family)
MCGLLGVARSSYYAWRERTETPTQARRRELGAHVRRVFDESRATFGCRRVAAALNREGHECSVGLVADLMRELGLKAVQPRAYKRTTIPGEQPVESAEAEQHDRPSRAQVLHCVRVEPDDPLELRLRAAGIAQTADAVGTWRRLRAVEGPGATIIDLYELAARPQGLRARDLPAAERYTLARTVMPEIWLDFDTTEGSERIGDVIVIVEYDPAWPARYQAWQRELRAALGIAAVRIEHVGSTSVPGLPAKPIIDVQVSVTDLANENSYVPALQQLGLQLRSRDAYHRYFRPYPGRPRDIHVHVCESGSDWEGDHLRFRDYLRTHPEACEGYAEAKRAAAAMWADDGLAYTDAKTEVILSIPQRAAEETH